jgi:hypothetical protein
MRGGIIVVCAIGAILVAALALHRTMSAVELSGPAHFVHTAPLDLGARLHPPASRTETMRDDEPRGPTIHDWGATCRRAVGEPGPGSSSAPHGQDDGGGHDDDDDLLEVPAYAAQTLARGVGELVVFARRGRRVVGELRGPALLPLVFTEAPAAAPHGASSSSLTVAVPYTAHFSLPLAGRYTLTVSSPGRSSLVCACPVRERPGATPRTTTISAAVPYVHGHQILGGDQDSSDNDIDGGSGASPPTSSSTSSSSATMVMGETSMRKPRCTSVESIGLGVHQRSPCAPPGAHHDHHQHHPGGFQHACGTHIEDEWVWQPRSCRMQVYDAARANRCLAGQRVVVVGDSTAEHTAHDLVRLLRGSGPDAPRPEPDGGHGGNVSAVGDSSHAEGGDKRWSNAGGAIVDYVSVWSGESDPRALAARIRGAGTGAPNAIMANIGMDHVARGDRIHAYPDDVAQFARALREAFPLPQRKISPSSATGAHRPLLVWRTTYASEARAQARSCVTGARVDFVNRIASDAMHFYNIPVLDTTVMSAGRPECSTDGMHRGCATSRTVTQAWLNAICNHQS